MKLSDIENHFIQQQKLLGNLADSEQFLMIFSLIEQVRELREQNDKLTVLNRHYYNHFYNGNIGKMVEDFKYLME
ncbi:hypothetical protein J7E63_13055 [Bacillus sp. ISL-75]|uniref:hypothetical protein n=1 Tax=Bacillus sp. ISL-75 TaxID=2819137 RepID=UPI001BEA64A2|nr:hypothetical protein [Bacillus sp. ISL-75]MBT2727868.1 hypothetical protein [Bacillus sp. ISL-75]